MSKTSFSLSFAYFDSHLPIGKQLSWFYSGCGHRETTWRTVRCNPVFRKRGACAGLQKAEEREDTGDCSGCRSKKLNEIDARIKAGRARLAAYGGQYLQNSEALQKDYD